MTAVLDVFDIPAVATAAADHLEAYGWRRGDLWRGADKEQPYDWGPTCALGAIGVVCGVRDVRSKIDPATQHDFGAAATATEDLIGEMPVVVALLELLAVTSIEAWNDEELARTAAEVVQAFRDLAIKHTPDAMTDRSAP